MDLQGSLVDTNIKIYPSEKFIEFLQTIPVTEDVPFNIVKYIEEDATRVDISKKKVKEKTGNAEVHFTSADIEIINKIKENIKSTSNDDTVDNDKVSSNTAAGDKIFLQDKHKGNGDSNEDNMLKSDKSIDDINSGETNDKLYLTTSDIDWVYAHINVRKSKGEECIPYLHELFQGTNIVMPVNRVIKRNPILEARCVKLRAQQEAREYRRMTKGVDNVRMRFPEDSISYQLKQMNRQLIAIGQFVISIFAGFLFGFRGVEWMVGNLDFGVRLLLGVMCALIIALAEIYFLAKKLNEELTMTETIQLGGPPKFANEPDNRISNSIISENKEHQD